MPNSKRCLNYCQMRALCSKLAVFEAENGQLTQAQASAEEEWRNKTSHLQSELNQATTQKVGNRVTIKLCSTVSILLLLFLILVPYSSGTLV